MSDITFITNEKGRSLKKRFEELIRETRYFDCLVGYFYISGFHLIYKSLESTEKIRILVGIRTDKTTSDIVSFSTNNLKNQHRVSIIKELSESTDIKDNLKSENGLRTFLEWLKAGKIQIKIYESRNIHAKVYISTFKEGHIDKGRVITGSSNFTKSGLQENLEFNVELKNRSDYEFAKEKFEELWKNAVDLDEHCIETLEQYTWLRQITPYELYLKCLYEYFEKDLSQPDIISETPDGIKTLEYQKQAILSAKKIVEEYKGVFISDVVGLGKTYMTVGLCKLLGGRTLVITPPILTREGTGSWKNILNSYGIYADVESLGQLDKILNNSKKYENVVIDEAHRFRNEYTMQYDLLHRICHNRKVILVTATPYNNRLDDIQSLINLFQSITNSSIPGITNLESYFSKLKSKLPNRREDPEGFKKISSENAKQVREKVLKHLMVRRTRADIKKYFKKDLESGQLTFPQVEKPIIAYYQLDSDTDTLFHETIRYLLKEITYVRYSPLLELKEEVKRQKDIPADVSQLNMRNLMRILLVKRLDSSFHAFKLSLDRFIGYYEEFIKTYERKGIIYVSKEYANKIFQYLEAKEINKIEDLIKEGKAEEYRAEDFKPNLKNKLDLDLNNLRYLKTKWDKINTDPKIEELVKQINEGNFLKKNKIILFTEFKDTAEYIFKKLNNYVSKVKPFLFHGSVSSRDKDIVTYNFDANVKIEKQKNEYNFLVTTDVLSESVNLHRSNIIINYDIPWNPTKMMQRVGRINRLSTKFDKLHIFNFLPTKQSNDILQLNESAEAKVESFFQLLGRDSYILTEDESLGSKELFKKLTIFEEEESANPELEHYKVIEDIRDNHSDLFKKIKSFPKKIRSSKKVEKFVDNNFLITFFKKKNMKKFFISDNKNPSKELDFLQAANILKANEKMKTQKILIEDFYNLFNKNKKTFSDLFETKDIIKASQQSIENKTIRLLKYIKQNYTGLTESNEDYLDRIIKSIEIRNIQKKSLKNLHDALSKIEDTQRSISNTKQAFRILETYIDAKLLVYSNKDIDDKKTYKKEVILSLYGKSK